MKKNNRPYMVILAIMALILASLACNAVAGQTKPTQRPPTSTAIPTKAPKQATIAPNQGQNSIEATITAFAQAKSGQPITIVIDENQVNSAISDSLKTQTDLGISNLQVLLRDGQIQILGNFKQGGFDFPLKIVLSVSVNSQNQPAFQIVSATVGPFEMPQAALAQVQNQLDSAMANYILPQTSDMVIKEITIADGKMTIAGVKR